MREVERAFFEQNKMNIDLKEEIAGVRLPLPTESDLIWAKKAYKSSQKKQLTFYKEAIKEKSLWRTAFMLAIPYEYKFMNKTGLSKNEKEVGIRLAIDVSSAIEPLKIIMHSKPYIHSTDVEYHVSRATPEQLKLLLKYQPKPYRVENDWYSAMNAAVHSKSLEKVKMLYENGGDIFTNSDQRIEAALKKQCPEIARFLKEEKAKKMAEAGIDDPDAPATTPALPAPVTGSDKEWEKMGDDEIAKHRIFDEGRQQISDIFNFSSQQIMHIHTHLTQQTSEMKVQNFTDLPNQAYIAKAAEELVKQGGKPNMYDAYGVPAKKVHKLHIKKS